MPTRKELMAAIEAKRSAEGGQNQAQAPMTAPAVSQGMTREQLMRQVELKRQGGQAAPIETPTPLQPSSQPTAQLTEITTPAPAEESLGAVDDGPSFFDTAGDFISNLDFKSATDLFTGASRETQQTKRLPEIGSVEVKGLGPALKIASGLLASANEDDQIDIIRNAVPGTKFFRDSKNNVIVKYPFDAEGNPTENGQEAVLNQPGFSFQDGVNAAANVLAFSPSSALAGIGKSLLAKMFIGSAGAVATQEALQEGAQALGAERELSGGDRLAAGVLGGLSEVAAPALSAAKQASRGRQVNKAIVDASPDIATIKSKTKEAYKALDELGVKVKPRIFGDFASGLSDKLKKQGIDKTLHPNSTAVMARLLDEAGSAKSFSELDTLRRVAKGAADSIDKSDARFGSLIVSAMDDSIDKLAKGVGGTASEARGLAQRAFKSQTITDMIENAGHTASGLENGLRIEARKILKNPRKRRGFTADELKAISKIEKGTTAANAAKFLGKFGVSEGQATSMLGASIGVGGGGAIGSLLGPGGAAIGAITVPALGQIAKKTAQKITLKNTKFADSLARAGKSAKKLTSAYIENTPKSKRSISDLTDILLDSNIKPADLIRFEGAISPTKKFIADSYFFASQLKDQAKASAQLLNTEEESGE